ncbi:MAG: hypothetical protein KDE04_22795, partial [Anaerolineales bacterium]|nr:hypothetical protein [Anaerolineales bacterium]
SFSLSLYGHVLLHEGDLGRATDHFEHLAASFPAGIIQRLQRVDWHIWGPYYWLTGRYEPARTLLAEVLSSLAERSQPYRQSAAQALYGRILLAEGQAGAAQAQAVLAWRQLQGSDGLSTFQPPDTLNSIYQVLAATGHPDASQPLALARKLLSQAADQLPTNAQKADLLGNLIANRAIMEAESA